MSLIQQLVEQGKIDKKKAISLEYEAKTSGKKEEEVILDREIVPERVLFELKSKNLKVPLKEVVSKEIPLKVLKLIPEESVKYYRMVPLSKKGNVLEIGMVYPEDIAAQEALKFLARRDRFEYKISLITPASLEAALKQYRTLTREVGKALKELETEISAEKIKVKPGRLIKLERLVEEAPIVRVVAVILNHAVEGRASDIHIEPGQEKLRARFRLDGVLHSSILLPLRIHPAVIARIKILSNLRIDETRVPQDGRFSTKIKNRNIDFRVSTFPTALGEKIAIRVLDPQEGLKSQEKLGMTERNLKITQEAIKKPYGLILATGPTGSGKTTTLYSLLRLLNKEGVNIMTLEDPVEYLIEGVNQSQIRPEIGYDFSSGLRYMVRQDPDIIMVGEIRDEDSASLVTHAALTGHLVLSTIHTSNAIGVIPRLIDMKVRPFLIPPTLAIAIAQRLVRRLCPYCRKKVKPGKETKEMILKEIESLPLSVKKNFKIPSPLYIYKPKGCKKCNFKGYMGRTAVFEVLKMTDQLAEIILGEISEAKIFQEAKRQGMITMKQDGILKMLQGITSVEEVLRVAEEK